MAPQIFSSLFLILFTSFMCFSNGNQLIVGGEDGWVVNPTESYTHWPQRLRFQVNDTIAFKYDKRTDSVMEVSREDYDTCNSSNPTVKMEDGNSVFKFDRSGPFYFITGNKTNCDRGQKVVIVVLAVRAKQHAAPPPPPPAAGNAPPPAATPSPPPIVSPSSPIPAATPPAAEGPTAGVAPSPSSPGAVAPGPHQKSAAAAGFNPTVVMVLSMVSVVLSTVGFGGFIVSFS